MSATALIVGGDSQLGRAIAGRLSADGVAVVMTTRRGDTTSVHRLHLDLAADLSTWQPPAGVALAYLCAATTSLDASRRDPQVSWRVNVEGLWAVAEALLARGVVVVYPSSNLVYDGSVAGRKPCEAVCPTTEYGRQKAEMERRLLGHSGAAVVRLTKVLGPDLPLLQGWVSALRRGEAIRPFSDMVMAPVPLDFAAQALCEVGDRRLGGITQVSAAEDITYEQLARHIARRLNADQSLVEPQNSRDAGLAPEAVPRHTTLDAARLRAEIGLVPPDVWEAVDTALEAAGVV